MQKQEITSRPMVWATQLIEDMVLMGKDQNKYDYSETQTYEQTTDWQVQEIQLGGKDFGCQRHIS